MKINELWLRCRKWSDVSILGYLIVGIVKIVFIFIIFALLVYGLYMAMPYSDEENPIQDFSLKGSSKVENENCTVTGINIHGGIITYVPEHAEGDTSFDYDVTASEYVDGMITQANENPKIKAIIIEVDSWGGHPVAGEEMANAVKNSEKPVIAFIREAGASAAYWAISGADKIFASENSNVGSIGITRSYINNVEWNKKEGYTYEQLSIGKYKDSGIPDKPLTSEEKAIFVRDMNIIYENFMEAVSENRNIPIEKVKSFADGSTVLGEKAKELGLIDEIGGINEAERYVEDTIGEKPEVCW